MNTMEMIIMLQRTNEDGISPMSLRTFSERSSILSCGEGVGAILISEFKLVFNEVIVCTFCLY